MKNILLIGGSHGIGAVLAQTLSKKHNVYAACRTKGNLPDTITYIPFNALNDQLQTTQLPETLDGLVYLPGSITLKPFKGLKEEDFLDDLSINFLAMVKLIQSVLPQLSASKSASIVLFSSVAATKGMPFHTSIAASKAAIEGFARALAAEMTPKIRVNVIAPSLTNTPLAEKFLNSEQKQERASERHPLKRIGQPKDIAKAAQFLLSNKSSWITGEVIHIDGGMSSLVL